MSLPEKLLNGARDALDRVKPSRVTRRHKRTATRIVQATGDSQSGEDIANLLAQIREAMEETPPPTV